MTIRTYFPPKDDPKKAESVMHLVIEEVAALVRSNKKVRIRVDQSAPKRSLEQNSFSHAWYQQMAREFPEDDALGWKCYCKLAHGVPILFAESEEFRDAYACIGSHTYEESLKIMRILPITSIMTKKQLNAYADAVKDDFARRGVHLEVQERGRG
jgi:hypothetical protein